MERIVKINDKIITDALHLSGMRNVNSVISLSLEVFVKSRLKKQEFIKRYKGKLSDASEHVGIRREEIRAVK